MKSSKSSFLFLIAGLVAIFTFVTVSTPAFAQRNHFLIGSAIAHTGKFAREGTNLKKAYDLWLELVNAQGGIEVKGTKYPVKIIYYDDKSDSQTTTKLVEKLISEDKVDLIFGPFSSDCVGPSSTITEKYKVPMIESAGNATPIFQRGFKYLFCTLPLAEDQLDLHLKTFTTVSPRPTTVAVIAPKTPFYLSSAKGFKKSAEKFGFKVIHEETYPAEMEDITPILQKVKAKNPDILCTGSHTIVAMMVMKQSKEIDFNPKAFVFSYGVRTPEFIKELGKDAEYAIEGSYLAPKAPFKDSLYGTTRQFLELFKKKYNIEPDGTLQGATAGGMAVAAAIQKAGLTPPLTEEKRIKLREELSRLDIITSAGPIRFNAIGVNVANSLCIYQVQKGMPVCVDPKDWADAPLVFPTPNWKNR